MPQAGRVPKGQTVSRHAPRTDWADVEDKPYTGKSPAARSGWAKPTRDWWHVVRRMPHCVLWTPADWQFALETAELKDLLELERRSFITSTELLEPALANEVKAHWLEGMPVQEIELRVMRPASAGLAAEMRQRAAILGLTHDARTKLRIRYVTSETQPAPSAARVSARDRIRRVK